MYSCNKNKNIYTQQRAMISQLFSTMNLDVKSVYSPCRGDLFKELSDALIFGDDG